MYEKLADIASFDIRWVFYHSLLSQVYYSFSINLFSEIISHKLFQHISVFIESLVILPQPTQWVFILGTTLLI